MDDMTSHRQRCRRQPEPWVPEHLCVIPGCPHIHPESTVDEYFDNAFRHLDQAHGLDRDWVIANILTPMNGQ